MVRLSCGLVVALGATGTEKNQIVAELGDEGIRPTGQGDAPNQTLTLRGARMDLGPPGFYVVGEPWVRARRAEDRSELRSPGS